MADSSDEIFGHRCWPAAVQHLEPSLVEQHWRVARQFGARPGERLADSVLSAEAVTPIRLLYCGPGRMATAAR